MWYGNMISFTVVEMVMGNGNADGNVCARDKCEEGKVSRGCLFACLFMFELCVKSQ